jgi:hypothetical protein
MPTHNGTTPPVGNQPPMLATLAALLLCIEAQERAGLPRRLAVLAAVSEYGVNPALVLGQVREVTP